VISHSFAFSPNRHLSTLVSMLELSPPLPVLLLLRVGGLSLPNTRALLSGAHLPSPFESLPASQTAVCFWYSFLLEAE
jgi:hypothetical protein